MGYIGEPTKIYNILCKVGFRAQKRPWSTWRCFPVLQLRCALILREPCSGSWRTMLWFSENCAQIKIFNACLFKGSQEQSFFLQALLFTAFLVTVLKILTYALVSTWSSVSSGWEHVKRKMHPDKNHIKILSRVPPMREVGGLASCLATGQPQAIR